VRVVPAGVDRASGCHTVSGSVMRRIRVTAIHNRPVAAVVGASPAPNVRRRLQRPALRVNMFTR
jgi:hypothetical protein